MVSSIYGELIVYGVLTLLNEHPLAFLCSFKTVFFMTCPFLLFIIQSTGWEVGNVLVS